MNTDLIIPFGKYRGNPIDQLDLGYVAWMLDNASHWWVADNREALEALLVADREAALAEMPEYQLNESQAHAASTLQAWLFSDEHAAKLEGGAGYGKSFTTMEVVKRAQEMGYKVQAMAPSYVATQVLAKQLDPLRVTTMTIARTLKLTVVHNGPEDEYVPSEDTYPALAKLLGPMRLLLVDEYSMVGDDIGKLLLQHAEQCGGKLLAIGDLSQLPPVKQAGASCLSRIECTATLTEPMRYSRESDLYAVEQHLRHNPYGLEWQAFEGAQVVLHADMPAMLGAYVQDYRSNPKEDLRMMFFRRADVVAANNQIRDQLHGVNEAREHPVLDGEKLMVMATTNVEPLDIGPDEDPKRFYSSTTFMAEDIEERMCYVATVNGRPYQLMFMVTENKADESKLGGAEYNQEVKRLAEEALESGSWAEWRAFKQQFIPVGYAYAMTVHRCQGQTVDRAYFAPKQLMASGSMGKALTYVAGTRARKAIHVMVGA